MVVLELLKILKKRQTLYTKKNYYIRFLVRQCVSAFIVDNIKGVEDIQLIDMDEDALDIGRKFLGREL